MTMSADGARLRSWASASALGLAAPLAALVAAVLVLATSAVTWGLVLGLVATLVPWALVAGDVKVRPWPMALLTVGVPGLVMAVFEAPGAIFLALLGAAWLAASGESRAAELAANLTTVFVLPLVMPVAMGHGWGEEHEGIVFFATGGLLSWFMGRMLRRERELVGALQDAQTRLNAAAAAEERQRIAHEVHDVVGHSLTVMLLNVAGARRVLVDDPTAAGEALDRAEQVGRDSLQSVRSVVDLLRTPGDPDGDAPLPGAGDIAALADTAAAAGLPVRVEVDGAIDDVDPYAGLAAYRLVQEAISNAEHHAPGAAVLVRLVCTEDRLSVSVRNGPARTPPPPRARRRGVGLDGMRHRITAVGGTVTAGPDDDGGGWRVDGSIPLRPADTHQEATR